MNHSQEQVQQMIHQVCNQVRDILIEKNNAYGNSAINPIRIFSKADALDGIYSRIDDKLSRIAQVGINDSTEDTELDLMGYLVLARVAKALADPALPKDEPDRETWTRLAEK